MDRYTAEVNKLLAKGIGIVKTADQATALRLRYVGSATQSKDYADAVVVSAASLTLSVNGVADTTVGTAGVLAFATFTTLGKLVDGINKSSNWEAEIVAGLRSDLVSNSSLLARSTSTFKPWTEVTLYWDTSVNTGLDVVLESRNPFDYVHPKSGITVKADHRVSFQRVVALDDTSDASTTTCYVYELGPDKATVLRTLATFVAADNTEKDSGVDAPVITASYGNSILVRFHAAAYQDAGAYLKVFGVRE